LKDIVFENVCKTYGDNRVVSDLNLAVRDGERLILLGPSGCGKSTTLRMIAGLEEITSGKLYMGGRCCNHTACGERNVSMVFQNYALFPHMTVEGNITYGLKARKYPREEIVSRLSDVLEMLNLSELKDRKPKELSGGQRQRVALARAIVKRSDYLLLDEPLSNLDAQLRQHARKELVRIHEAYNQTFVYVTHDQTEAMTVGDRIALLYEGRLMMADTPRNVYHRPANVFTAKFIGSPSCNIALLKMDGNSVLFGEQRLALPECWAKIAGERDRICLGIRPEHVRLYRVPAEGALTASVMYVEDYGNRVGVYFDVDGHEMTALCDEDAPSPGSTVYFLPDFSNLHLFDCETSKSLGYPYNMMTWSDSYEPVYQYEFV
jgi:sn-glycerol 3-phosphate transport system ATP-binding protein